MLNAMLAIHFNPFMGAKLTFSAPVLAIGEINGLVQRVKDCGMSCVLAMELP